MAIGKQISDGSPDGASLGQSVTDKISFYGVTPVSQPTNAAQASVTATSTATGFGFCASAELNSLVSLVNQIQSVLVNCGLMKGS